jgi:hypothetical protein
MRKLIQPNQVFYLKIRLLINMSLLLKFLVNRQFFYIKLKNFHLKKKYYKLSTPKKMSVKLENQDLSKYVVILTGATDGKYFFSKLKFCLTL